ncbi:MAG: RHS repeat-associated core domain-containing protein [Acidobacteriota bacterium]
MMRAIYFGHRFLSTLTGRWLNRDPIGLRGGRNEYGFAANDPLTGIDIDGRMFALQGKGVQLPCGGWEVTWAWFG